MLIKVVLVITHAKVMLHQSQFITLSVMEKSCISSVTQLKIPLVEFHLLRGSQAYTYLTVSPAVALTSLSPLDVVDNRKLTGLHFFWR